MKNIDANSIEFGKVQAGAGRAAFEFIKKTVELCSDGKVSGIATTPINAAMYAPIYMDNKI